MNPPELPTRIDLEARVPLIVTFHDIVNLFG